MRSVALLLATVSFVLVACGGSTSTDDSTLPGASSSGSDSSCEPAADEKACGWDDGRLRSCAKIDTGIYGTAVTTYVNYRGPDPGLMCNGEMTIRATPTAGGPSVSTQPRNGRFLLALPPGSYDVCPTQADAPPGPSGPVCARVELAAGSVRRVDAGESRSVGGIYLSMRAK